MSANISDLYMPEMVPKNSACDIYPDRKGITELIGGITSSDALKYRNGILIRNGCETHLTDLNRFTHIPTGSTTATTCN